jgi:dCMP deaminase
MNMRKVMSEPSKDKAVWASAESDVDALMIKGLRQAHAQAASKSADPRTQTTAVLFSSKGEVILEAYNAPVAGGLLSDPSRLVSPEKYFWIEHSERALLQEAAKKGIATDQKLMGCSLFPCVDCARAIVGTGIKALVTTTPDFGDARWGDEFKRAMETLKAGGVEVRLVDKAVLASQPQPKGFGR